MQRRTFIHSLTSAAALVMAPELRAQQGLEQAKLITGFAAGGTSDVLCRRLSTKMTGSYAKSVIVENRTGAGGQIAIQAVKSAAPDGTTILQTPMSMLGIYPHIYKKLPYDPLKDLTPVSMGCVFSFGFAVGPLVPAEVTTVPQFLTWVKRQPNNGAFGSPAAGSAPHFIGALLGKGADADLRHVAYRGTQPAILDMIGGQIPAVCGPIGDFLPHLAGGKIRVLATTGEKRNKFVPAVSTLVEQGLKDMVFTEWFGLFLPAGAKSELVLGLNASLKKALAEPDLVEGLAGMGLEATSSSPEQLAANLARDFERWGPLVKKIGFTAET